jgi:DNA-binding transcriptional LysR family regulator
VLRVGTLTSIGRALYPAIIDHFAKRQPGWQVELRSFGWGDATGGPRNQACDAAVVWLPVDDSMLDSDVLAGRVPVRGFERWASAGRAGGGLFGEIADKPVAALRPSAGSTPTSPQTPPSPRSCCWSAWLRSPGPSPN